MTDDEVLRLIASRETLTTELKADAKKLLALDEIFENVVCLANADGGVLLIGVENDGTVTGLNPERKPRFRDPYFLQAAIFGNTVPPINTRISVHHLDAGEVIAVRVDRYPDICATTKGTCLQRVMTTNGPQCRPFYPHEQRARRIKLGLEDLTAQVIAGSEWGDLDPIEFERLRQTIKRAGGDQRLLGLDDAELAKALRLVETLDGELIPVVAGLLLLGREERLLQLLPTNQTAFQVIRGDAQIATNERMHAPLLRIIEGLEQRYEARKNEQEIAIGMLRMPVPEYAKESFREAINNALIHRDYALLGTTYVQWHPDHILITNPGSFPPGITQQNILTHEPKPRNPRLAEACARIGLVESSARGVDRIYEGQLRYGRPAPDYAGTDETAVRLILRGGPANLDFVRLLNELNARGPRLTLDDLIVLNQLQYERQLTVEEASQHLQKSEGQTRAVMERLVERGLAEGRGQKPRRYSLSAGIYQRLGQSEGYTRASGLERAVAEAMIMEHLRMHGTIKRSQAAELCHLGDDEAKATLRRMVDAGKLALQGEKKGAYYTLAAPPSLVPLGGQDLIEKVSEILRERGAATLQDLDNELARRGFEVAGNNKRNYLTAIMSRNKARFEGLGRGSYRLHTGTEGNDVR